MHINYTIKLVFSVNWMTYQCETDEIKLGKKK